MVFYSSVRRKLFFARKVFKSTYHIPPDLFSPSRSINKKESRPNKFKVIVTYNWYMSENKECIEKKPAQHSYLFRSINMFWSYLFASPQKQLQLCLNLIVWFEWKEEFCRRPKATNCSSNQSFYWCVFFAFLLHFNHIYQFGGSSGRDFSVFPLHFVNVFNGHFFFLHISCWNRSC